MKTAREVPGTHMHPPVKFMCIQCEVDELEKQCHCTCKHSVQQRFEVIQTRLKAAPEETLML